ncbi:uncharacterized protein DS421_6g195510 [Arachis hypogaea]|nr:uncharacterized protein DS421_6g195510 [Arachis hypogaea]
MGPCNGIYFLEGNPNMIDDESLFRTIQGSAGISFHNPYDVWMMKDYWDEESGVKLYSVGHVEMISRLVGFYKSNQLLWKGNDERLVMYERVPTSKGSSCLCKE